VVAISFAAIFVRAALPAPPIVIGFYRMLFASALIGSWLLLTRRGLGGERPGMLLALASGVCFGSDLAFWHTSLVLTGVGISTLLVNTTPVYVGLNAVLVLRQRLPGRFVAGAALALAGTLVLLGVPGPAEGNLRGALLALTGAVFYAGYLLLMSAARRGLAAAPAIFWMGLSATLTLGSVAALRGDAFHGFPATSWAAMGGAAVVAQLGGVLSVAWSLRYLPATLASVALLGQPVGTALLGWLLLREPISALQAAGGTCVLIGIGLASQATSLRRPAGT
jgi:drug/metabolite transporter (DMT)-like permease